MAGQRERTLLKQTLWVLETHTVAVAKLLQHHEALSPSWRMRNVIDCSLLSC